MWVHICIKVCVHVYVHAHRGQGTSLGDIPWAVFIFAFETRTLTGLDLTQWAGLAGQPGPEIHLSVLS